MNESETGGRERGEAYDKTIRRDGDAGESQAGLASDASLRANVGSRMDELMGLLSWLKTQQAKLGGRGKVETVDRIMDALERISEWVETGGYPQERPGADPIDPDESPSAVDQTFRGRLLDALSDLERGVRAMTDGKASMADEQVLRVETGLKDMEAILKIR